MNPKAEVDPLTERLEANERRYKEIADFFYAAPEEPKGVTVRGITYDGGDVPTVKTPEPDDRKWDRPPEPKLPARKRCSHQTSALPCAWPTCPAGVSGKQLRLWVARPDGSRYRSLYNRRRRETGGRVVFDWTPAT